MIELCKDIDCTGCSACANICANNCIKMQESSEGFLYPQIDTAHCVECGLCQKICPIINDIPRNITDCALAAWSIDDTIRTSSSSGGVFSVLASYIIGLGGVVYGAVYDDEMNVVHRKAETLAELTPMKSSKYVQSKIGNAYREMMSFLRKGRIVLFTGTPCQCAAAKSVAGHNTNLLTMDIVCHGVPSNMIFKDYIYKLQLKYGSFSGKCLTFRNLSGWGYKLQICSSDGKAIKLLGPDSIYLPLFLKGLLTRESCYNCSFSSIARATDITIADFWGIGKDIPFEHNTSKGCSMVLANTRKGNDILEMVSDKLFIEKRTLGEAVKYNMQLTSSIKRPEGRDKSYEYFFNHSLKQIYRRYTPMYVRARFHIKRALRII